MTEADRAERIRHYWLALGYTVNVTLRTVPAEASRHTMSGIRSDMENGLPRGYRDHTTNAIGIAA